MQLNRDAATLPSQGRALDCHRPLLLAAELPTGYGYWRPWRRAPETRRQLHPHCLWIAVNSPALPEIGRASGRERFAQHVAFTVVAVPYHKTQTESSRLPYSTYKS